MAAAVAAVALPAALVEALVDGGRPAPERLAVLHQARPKSPKTPEAHHHRSNTTTHFNHNPR